MYNPFTPLPERPLLLFGGPYGNLEALRAVLARAERLAIPDRNLLCTGDLAAYCADPQAVADLVRERNIAVVQGNCEASLGAGAADCGCGFEPGSACDALSAQWYGFARSALDAASREWMRALPASLAWAWGGRRWQALHAGRSSNNRFLFASTPAAELAAEVPDEADVVVAGHCGLPFTRDLGARVWHNPGVLGMPANDGTPRVWYSTVEQDPAGLVFRHRALDYDHRGARRRMLDRGLAGGYADALASGLWPSLDVLPQAERDATGQPLTAHTVRWSPAGATNHGAPTRGVAPVPVQE